MSFNDIRHSINNCLDLLIRWEIAITANPVVIETNGTRRRVTWKAPTASGTLQATYPFATVDEYREQIRNQAYSAVLFDGALLQISYDFKNSKLVGHRLCFYPCPFDAEPEFLETEPLLDIIDYYRSSDKDKLRLRSPIRFDYDPKNASFGHPAVHAHILWAHCRCAVDAPLSLGHFIHFVFYNFYPELWQEHDFLRNWKREFQEKTIAPSETGFLHISAVSGDAKKILKRRI